VNEAILAIKTQERAFCYHGKIMNFQQDFKKQLASFSRPPFEELALELFRFQARQNPVYASYLQHLGIQIATIKQMAQIPFLPISFFKQHEVVTGTFFPETIFLSSGTTQQFRSRHLVADVGFYLKNATQNFSHFYGDLSRYVFIALLPSYQEQGNSSLILMVEHFMRESGQPELSFFRHNDPWLYQTIKLAEQAQKQVILIGVTYGLLNLAAETSPEERELFSKLIIMETGGMKGRRKEMIRAEVHQELRAAFGVDHIHSEYGMTELLSQAYSYSGGIFRWPPTMRVLLRDPNDPFAFSEDRFSGGMNIIDLANVDSCAFIETQDLGRRHLDGSFEVLGRFDNSDIRGCNLLLA
jgi:hypothetical protein